MSALSDLVDSDDLIAHHRAAIRRRAEAEERLNHDRCALQWVESVETLPDSAGETIRGWLIEDLKKSIERTEAFLVRYNMSG